MGHQETEYQNDAEEEYQDEEMLSFGVGFHQLPQNHNSAINHTRLGVEGSVKEESVVTKANDSACSAAPVLKSSRSKMNVGCDFKSKSRESSSLLLNSDGSLPFYFIDAHEELYGPNSGIIYLFGKVQEAGGTYGSCCAVVNNMQRCIYVIPNGSVFPKHAISKLEEDVKENRISSAEFRSALQEMASVLKKEVKEKLFEQGVLNFTMTPVKRSYAFERSDIPMGEQYVIKITYPFKYSALPPDLRGEHFSALLGTNCSALEHFLIKRKITGPSWLSFLKFSSCSSAPHKVSWCKFEVTVDDPKEVRISKVSMQIPRVIVTSINLKTVINEKQNVNEIVSASVINCCEAKIDSPTSEWEKPGLLKHLTIVRKLEEGIFPMGFEKEVAIRNAKDITVSQESTEAALLNCLFLKIYNLDTDILVGHNISGFDLDVLLHRAQACQVKSHMWSKIGRLKRSAMPKLTKADTSYGSGASRGIMACTAGRLICDTYLCSRDLLKEVSYSLTPLAKTQLNKDRREIASHEIPKAFQSSRSLMELVECGEADARLSMELMFHLSILPLTRQLSNISGNLWGKTLQGARAQGVENLLLHKFHAYKYIVPDDIPTRGKNLNFAKRRLIYSVDGGNVDNLNTKEMTSENDPQQVNQVKRKKGPAYSGGLVLEPKKGLYDKYILLLDFNSLYPSIIREYNICFTTVERSADGSVPQLPSSKMPGILPELLKALVERREKVKESIKTASGLDLQQLDILQQALKLTANSIYGCLGYSNSRFYAKPLAELITSQGREILQSTVDLVQNDLKMEVIYGDTDSIMINSGLDDIKKSKQIASEVINKVNKKYEHLVIDLDAMFKRMLLLKKKKYAAVKVQFKDGKQYEVEFDTCSVLFSGNGSKWQEPLFPVSALASLTRAVVCNHQVIECKGLEMVRRDWSLLSKEVGDFCLSQILSGGSGEDVVVSIHNSLMKVRTMISLETNKGSVYLFPLNEVQKEMRKGEVALEKYVIMKTLTKPIEAYPDAKNQPHVQVALRLREAGYSSGFSAGDTIPYIICCEQGTTGSGSSAGIADRARHPDEMKRSNRTWMIDIDYYLAQQIHPLVSRLCAHIQGTNPAHLANCLGLDPSKFQPKSSEVTISGSSPSLLSAMDADDRYSGCEPLRFSCPSCSRTFECPSVSSWALMLSSTGNPVESKVEKKSHNFWCRLCCSKCQEEGEDRGRMTCVMIANQVKTQAKKFISTYYKGVMTCDDETCNYTTRGLNLRVVGDSTRGLICPNYPQCDGHIVRKYTEADLHRQLAYFCHILDAVRFLEKLELEVRIPLQKELARIQPMVDLAASSVQKLRNRCAYGWVQIESLCI